MKIGNKFGNWEVLSFEDGRVKCLCLGCNITIKNHLKTTLLQGKSRSCGCMKSQLTKTSWSKKDTKRNQLKVGDILNHWQIESFDENRSYMYCICLGCNTFNHKVHCSNAIRGTTKSCGCMTQEYIKKALLNKYGTPELRKIESIEKKRRDTNIERYGSPSPLGATRIKDKIKKTNIEKYGQASPISTSIVQNKKKKTLIERYGVDNPTKDKNIYERAQATLMERYGVEKLSDSEELVSRRKQTNIKKYGFEYPLQSSLIQDKVKKTTLDKYGVDNPRKSKEIIKQIKQSRLCNGTILTTSDGQLLVEICRKKNVKWNNAYKVFHQYGEQAFLDYCDNYQEQIYSTELAFINLLKDTFPSISKYDKEPKEFKLSRRPDFRLELNGKVLYVNIDGLYWHSQGVGRKLPKKYHIDLQKEFFKNGQTIFQFREDELRDRPNIVRSIVLNYFGMNSNRYAARKLEIKNVTYKDSKKFFNENHLMGSYKATSYGLYDGTDLICCLSIKMKDGELDISRFATKNFSSVAGGFSRLLDHVSKIHKPKKIVSWCDMRYSTGTSYKKLSFTPEKVTLGWRWTDFEHTFNRLKCRANMNDRKLTQAQQAEEFGWYMIYDAGQVKYSKII